MIYNQKYKWKKAIEVQFHKNKAKHLWYTKTATKKTVFALFEERKVHHDLVQETNLLKFTESKRTI